MREKMFSGRRALPCQIEPMESRVLLSAAPSLSLQDAPGVAAPMAITAKARSAKPVTQTSLRVQSGTLGQAVTFDTSVRAALSLGSPAGMVDLVDHGTTVAQLNLVPSTSNNPHFATSEATITIPAGAGGTPYFIGRHHIVAVFHSSDTLKSSHKGVTFNIRTPHYTRSADGLKVAVIAPGTGAPIQAGQTASMSYTGYLAKNGAIFDHSSAHTPDTFDFTVQATPEQVISGFDEGTVGMEVGETRVIYIPYKLGYGKQGSGSAIPPKANLVFLITLEGIS